MVATAPTRLTLTDVTMADLTVQDPRHTDVGCHRAPDAGLGTAASLGMATGIDSHVDHDAAGELGDALVADIYHALRRRAAVVMRYHAPGAVTLQPTVLVHEAYLRLRKQPGRRWQSRKHFYNAAAKAMRCFLIDRARKKTAVRHGGGMRRVEITITLGDPGGDGLACEDLLSLDGALQTLARDHSEPAEVVYLRSYCGLTLTQTAEALDICTRTVERRWKFAKGWLRRHLGDAAQ